MSAHSDAMKQALDLGGEELAAFVDDRYALTRERDALLARVADLERRIGDQIESSARACDDLAQEADALASALGGVNSSTGMLMLERAHTAAKLAAMIRGRKPAKAFRELASPKWRAELDVLRNRWQALPLLLQRGTMSYLIGGLGVYDKTELGLAPEMLLRAIEASEREAGR